MAKGNVRRKKFTYKIEISKYVDDPKGEIRHVLDFPHSTINHLYTIDLTSAEVIEMLAFLTKIGDREKRE